MKLSRKFDEFSAEVSHMKTIDFFHMIVFHGLCLVEHLLGQALLWHSNVSVVRCCHHDYYDISGDSIRLSLS